MSFAGRLLFIAGLGAGAIAVEIDRPFPSPFVALPLTLFGLVAFVLGIGMAFGLIGPKDREEPPADTSSAPEAASQ
jgi:hypothetical protein